MPLLLIYQDPATASTQASHTTIGANLTGEIFTKSPAGTVYYPLLACYAEIYGDALGSVQTIPDGSTYTKITGFGDNGVSANATADYANSKITVTTAGVYRIAFTLSLSSDTNNVTFIAAPFVNGVEQTNIHFERKVTTASDTTSVTMTGLINVATAPLDLDIRMKHDHGSGVDVTTIYSNLSIQRIS